MRNELSNREPTRRYIGASSISNPCTAYLALTMRGFPGDAPSPQLIRIFNQGHSIETLVVNELRQAGHTIEEINPADGKQWGYSDNGGHHRAHLDGFITLLGGGERMTLEIKSMNRKSFDSFVKKGVKLSHPHYYDQCVDGLQLVMHNGGNETKCLFVSYCKDNSQYHVEIIQNDPYRSKELDEKVSLIMGGYAVRTGSHAKEYACTGCFKRTSCWTPNVPPEERGCWHCEYADPMKDSLAPIRDKRWYCTINKMEATATCDVFKLFRPRKAP